MNSQSTIPTPARDLNNSAKGPFVAKDRNPKVGEPPFNHALLHITLVIPDSASRQVAKPSPINLSKKAHKNIRPKDILVRAQIFSPLL